MQIYIELIGTLQINSGQQLILNLSFPFPTNCGRVSIRQIWLFLLKLWEKRDYPPRLDKFFSIPSCHMLDRKVDKIIALELSCEGS